MKNNLPKSQLLPSHPGKSSQGTPAPCAPCPHPIRKRFDPGPATRMRAAAPTQGRQGQKTTSRGDSSPWTCSSSPRAVFGLGERGCNYRTAVNSPKFAFPESGPAGCRGCSCLTGGSRNSPAWPREVLPPRLQDSSTLGTILTLPQPLPPGTSQRERGGARPRKARATP